MGKSPSAVFLVCVLAFADGAAWPNRVLAAAQPPAAPVPTAWQMRLRMEQAAHDNPFLLLPYRPNYILPLAYNSKADQTDDPANGLDRMEVKFQVSLKVLLREGLFGDHGDLYVAYTNQSWWQLYNEELSRPFRETNHEPEIFAFFRIDDDFLGMRASSVAVGLNHQSNGRGIEGSRSWNRIFAEVVLERGEFIISFRPWYRLPEHEKASPSDPSGDDNPDITEFMGQGQLSALYHGGSQRVFFMARNNLSKKNRGAVEWGWTFPLTRKVKGYLQYFNGYGESLIDYNVMTNRVGVGFLLADWL